MKTNEKKAVWFLLTTLVSVFTLTMLLLIQGVSKLYYIAAWGLLLLQILGLIRALMENNKPEHPLLKWIGRLHFLVSFAVFFYAAATYLMMTPQFHRPIQADAKGDIASLDMEAVRKAENSYVFETDTGLYVIFPEYTSVEYVFDQRPSMKDADITFFATSAFFEQTEMGFRHENVTGDHAHQGVYYEGAKNFDRGAFTFWEGTPHFVSEEPKQAIRTAAEHGGEGFEQYIPIRQGELIPLKMGKLRCYRVLAELNGRLCIVDSKTPVHFDDFIGKVHELGVTNAAYLDMGGKSSYSQYRNRAGKPVKLFGGLPTPIVHSWIVFRK